MKERIIILSVFLFSIGYCWDCPQNQNVQLQGLAFPANPDDATYPSNCQCNLVIPAPNPGYYVKVYVDADDMSPQDSFIFYDDRNLKIKYDPIVTPEIGSPRSLTIAVKTFANTKGTFSIRWVYLKIADNKVPIQETVASSQMGALVVTEISYVAPYLISANEAIALVTAGASDERLRLYNMFTFVFKGEGVTGEYLGSLYSMLDASVFDCNTDKITIASTASFDCGVIIAKVRSDIVGYNYRLIYNWDLDKEVVLDGSQKPTALSIYSADAGNVYISSPVFENDAGILKLQTQDLRPNSAFLATYGPKNSLNKLPQAMPGYVKTLVAVGSKITVPVSLDEPKAYSNVPDGSYTLFTSRNFLARGATQTNSVTFSTNQRFNMTFDAIMAFDGTMFTVRTTDGTDVKTVKLRQTQIQSFFGTKFEISYPVSADMVTAGGMSALSFLALDGSPENGKGTTLTPTASDSPSTTTTPTPTTSDSSRLRSILTSLLLLFLAVY